MRYLFTFRLYAKAYNLAFRHCVKNSIDVKNHRVLNCKPIVHIIQVMIQPQNRKMSFSCYICALAVADTIVLLSGKLECHYLR